MKNNLNYIVVGAAIFLIGAVVGVVADPYLPAPLSNAKKGYQSGFSAARTLVENSSFGGFFHTPDDVRILSGTVTAVSGGRITIHLQPVNPFDNPSLADRTVLISASTTVNELVPKDSKLFQSEMDTFIRATQGTTTDTKAPPIPFITTAASAASIKVGDSINVSALQNVKNLKEFTASDINILLKTSTP